MQHAVPDSPAAHAESGPSDDHAPRGTRATEDLAVSLYRHMLRLRLVSARMIALQRSERIAFHSSSIGEESAIVAAALAARPQDWVFPGTREWGAALVRGLPLGTYMHHAFGTAEDPAKGHAAPDHPPARSVRVAPASGIVGAHAPQAVGFAWAARIRKEDVATIAIFGDGATSTGDFHNAMNFAGVFRTPCVLVCRNNGRAGAEPTARQTKTETMAEKAVAYGVASARVDGADALATLALLREALTRAVAGKGTTLVEIVTRPPPSLDGRDVLALDEEDALLGLRRVLARDGKLDAAADEAMRAEIRAEIDQAEGAAERAPKPSPATVFEDVFATVPPYLAAQRARAGHSS